MCYRKTKDTDAGEIVEAAFQEVKPGPGKDYMCHPTIKTFLEKTLLDLLASDKRKRVDYFACIALKVSFFPVMKRYRAAIGLLAMAGGMRIMADTSLYCSLYDG